MTRDKKIQVRMTLDELKELKKLADAKGLSESAYVRLILKEKWDDYKKPG